MPQIFEGIYYKIDDIVASIVSEEDEINCLFQSKLFLTPLQHIIQRRSYDINDLLGDLGGVFRVLITSFGLVFYPVTQFLFYLNSSRKLYLARTWDNDLLRE